MRQEHKCIQKRSSLYVIIKQSKGSSNLLYLRIFLPLIFFFSCLFISCTPTYYEEKIWKESLNQLQEYKYELAQFRKEFGEKPIPDVSFFLFGMGDRQKLVYKNGQLINSSSGKVINKWDIKEELIIPSEYKVLLRTTANENIVIQEDSISVWIIEGNQKPAPVADDISHILNLPDFMGKKYPRILKTLHQEILINIVDGRPFPNYFVYNTPWMRDGVMVAMCLEKTNNVSLLKDWVLNLKDPYDRNNAGEEEADNLGQVLYLISLFADSKHPLVDSILQEAKRFEVVDNYGKYIKGRTDFDERPVYQTKFLKWGLKKLNIAEDYDIPPIPDNYSFLFWWDYKDSYTKFSYEKEKNNLLIPSKTDHYPYLRWAFAHFSMAKACNLSNRDYPLTWEAHASQADYKGMNIIDKVYLKEQLAAPHTWHASEAFLYLFEL